MSDRFSITGGSRLKANVRRFESNWTERKARALLVCANRVLAKAVDRCPEDKGDARGSGRVVVSAKGQSVSVVFGDRKTEAYILALHEHLSVHSPFSWLIAEANGHPVQFHPIGTGPKFLERSWLEEFGEMAGTLKDELNVEKVGL